MDRLAADFGHDGLQPLLQTRGVFIVGEAGKDIARVGARREGRRGAEDRRLQHLVVGEGDGELGLVAQRDHHVGEVGVGRAVGVYPQERRQPGNGTTLPPLAIERLRHQALDFVLADLLDQAVAHGPVGKRVNCVGEFGDEALPPECGPRPTEGSKNDNCVGWGEASGIVLPCGLCIASALLLGSRSRTGRADRRRPRTGGRTGHRVAGISQAQSRAQARPSTQPVNLTTCQEDCFRLHEASPFSLLLRDG